MVLVFLTGTLLVHYMSMYTTQVYNLTLSLQWMELSFVREALFVYICIPCADGCCEASAIDSGG